MQTREHQLSEYGATVGAVLDVEIIIETLVCIDSHTIFDELVVKLWAKTEGLGLEIGKFKRLSLVRGQLNSGLARRRHEKLLFRKTRDTCIEVEIDADGIVRLDIHHVVGDAGCG